MVGEQGPEKNDNVMVQSVTSVGNSWIICRSKSHSGRIYYFNTLTGEAAWNLSDPEIEKAKNRTNIYQNQTGGEIEGCPEPKDPPMDTSPKSNTGTEHNGKMYYPPRVYNKQIINNQFSKQTYVPYVPPCANCNSQAPQTTMNSLGLNVPVPHNCTPNVWAVPPNHQILFASSTMPSPSIQPHTSVNVEYNNNIDQPTNVHVQNTSLSLSRRFNLIQSASPIRNYPRRHNSACLSQRNSAYKKFNNNPDDLRQKLSARRKSLSNWNKSTENFDQDRGNIDSNMVFNRKSTQKIQIIKPVKKTSTPSDADDKWLKENATMLGTQLTLNVIPLKSLVTSGENSTCWYLVADMNVLLNNIHLINVIINSDETCHLMVPDYIMAEIQNASRQYDTEIMSRAHHVLQILSQQFASGCAVMGKDPISESNKLHIFDFCTKLSEQDHDVVLVSNNIQLEKYRSTSTIPLLTVSELKNLLIAVKAEKRRLSLGDIKITVPNNIGNEEIQDFAEAEEEQNETNKPQLTTSNCLNKRRRIVSECTPKPLTEDNETCPAVLSKKPMEDVGVQTDFASYSQKADSVSVQTDMVDTQKADKTTITESDQTDSIHLIESDNRRGIQLKRNLYHQPAIDNNLEKKQFKWRRKRVGSAPNSSSDEKATSSLPSWNDKIMINGISNTNDIHSTDRYTLNPEGAKASYDEPNDSSDAGSSCCIHKIISDKIIIEETSTSGIISNSASTVDTESIHSVKPNEEICDENANQDRDKSKCAMFEVESSVMEENLRMRCDEWINRFVQIMEEVLTQVLQQDPPFFNRKLPPPWTIHEAIECIKKKFCNDSDVIDAANKLAGVLLKISDGKGKINVELKPEEFMEMYSYGVYLVDSLQSILNSSEDLESAVDSLVKLLNDIKDSCEGHTDAFMDNSHTSDVDVTRSGDAFSNQRKYNLRSAQKKQPQDHEKMEKPVKFIRNIDKESDTLFSILGLQKKNENEDKKHFELKSQEKINPINSNPKRSVDHESNEPTHEPKIIRNFSKCVEFEEKLKKQQKYLDALNYPEDFEVDELEQYSYYDDKDMNYDYANGEYEAYNGMETDQNYEETEKKSNDGEHDNIVCDGIIKYIVNEIQETFLAVHSFCDQTRNELNAESIMSSPRKFEIREKAEKARSHLDVLYTSLNGILCRENGKAKCENNLLAAFKQFGFNLGAAKTAEYRNIISKYSRQANILLDAVDVVIETVS